jgi:hypothetical protein
MTDIVMDVPTSGIGEPVLSTVISGISGARREASQTRTVNLAAPYRPTSGTSSSNTGGTKTSTAFIPGVRDNPNGSGFPRLVFC